jgi:hypothetical protein
MVIFLNAVWITVFNIDGTLLRYIFTVGGVEVLTGTFTGQSDLSLRSAAHTALLLLKDDMSKLQVSEDAPEGTKEGLVTLLEAVTNSYKLKMDIN